MERKYAERLKRSFKKSLLDSPVPNSKIKFFFQVEINQKH